jgi:Lrp/AsnC family transcriptional regulator, leucine-responsive regulatory protein
MHTLTVSKYVIREYSVIGRKILKLLYNLQLMKDIREKLVALLRTGSCTPQIAQIARKLREPSTTIHYNIKKLEKDGVIKTYKAVLDHKKINEGFCTYVLLHLATDEYGNPEKIAAELAKYEQIESIDIITGDWEMLLKVRTKDMDGYYEFAKSVISRKGVAKSVSLNSMKQIKSEFI